MPINFRQDRPEIQDDSSSNCRKNRFLLKLALIGSLLAPAGMQFCSSETSLAPTPATEPDKESVPIIVPDDTPIKKKEAPKMPEKSKDDDHLPQRFAPCNNDCRSV